MKSSPKTLNRSNEQIPSKDKRPHGSPSDSRPLAIWFSHLKTDEERQAFLKHLSLSSGDMVLRRLKQIINQRLDQTVNENEPYDSPAWAYKQADLNGRRKELKTILDLLEFI